MYQASLFPQFREDPESTLTIDEAAKSLHVSTASIKNWIKAGYLEQLGKSQISTASFIDFKENVAGQEKLTNRANKSLKDFHDHDKLIQEFEQRIKDELIDSDSLGGSYETSLSNAYRNKEGIYYTPANIVDRFFDYLPEDCSNLTFCDPCCGSGNFLIAASKHGFKPENIFGFDIDPIAVKIATKRISERTGYKTNNIVCSDFLDVHGQVNKATFDVVFTNPPWGKKIEKSQREKIAHTLLAGQAKDTSALFFFACIRCLNKEGYLGLLLQDAFFNIASFEDARRKALTLDIRGLIDFGKPFKGLLTKAKGIILKNQDAPNANLVQCEVGEEKRYRVQNSFTSNPKSIINFSCTTKESAVIKHLYNLEHLTLAGRAKYGLGIVTGNNKKYCVSQPKDGYIPVYRGADIHKNKLEEPSAYIPSDLTLYQQVAPIDLYLAREKLVYRFISSDLVFYLDREQIFFLNSANMFVLDKDFPITAEQLAHLLNSEIINWVFRTLFETHKILRSDIETLPIHAAYFNVHTSFSEESYLNHLGIEKGFDGTFRIKNSNLQ